MKVFELFQQVKTAEVEKIMKEKWFSHLWEEDEDFSLPDNFVNTSLFTLRNITPKKENTDTVSLLITTEDGHTYREAYIEDENEESLGYHLRPWNEFLGLTIHKETLDKHSLEEIAAVLLSELPMNQTEEEVEETLAHFNAFFQDRFYKGPLKIDE